MINTVSSYLNLVNNLNNSKSASKKGEKPERSSEFEVEDVVEISSGLKKGNSYKKEIRIEDIQAKTSENLTKEEEKVVEALKERDREVRRHEQDGEDSNKINHEGEFGNIDSAAEAENSDRSAEEKNQTSAPAASVYGLERFETGKLLNKIV